MKKSEVKVGSQYIAKVSGRLAQVRIDRENPHGGWDAVNVATKKSVRIKSAQRLRAEAGVSKAEVKAAKAAVAAQVGAGANPAGETAKDAKATPASGGATNPLEAHYRGQKDAAKAEKAAKVAAYRKEVAEKLTKPDPELDAAAKAAEANRAAKKAKAAKPKGKRKPGCLDAAVRVLQEAGKPMGCQDIVKEALAKGYWQTKGATPAATLYAAIIRECAAKGKTARFRRAEVKETKDGKAITLRGYFTLTGEHAKKNQ
ncbi:MAG: hypothetical protein FJ288_17860 [Planctomycetes bacterium]|nr:hypothetical protein [Planctomycetota bacterium]